MDKKIDYQEAILELENTLKEIESSELAIDLLSEKIKRSLYLIDICKTKLKTTEEDVKKIIDELMR